MPGETSALNTDQHSEAVVEVGPYQEGVRAPQKELCVILPKLNILVCNVSLLVNVGGDRPGKAGITATVL